ncbi:MAG: alkaline phosphatase [bacterium]|jgi:alkaline phosphatase
MRIAIIAFAAATLSAQAQGPGAKNVILFLGDAAGIPTLNAASIYKYDAPHKLFIHGMPHMALSDTSAADAWATDSAAGMSAIVTGRKTNNGVISQSAEAVRGVRDGEPLDTILEIAERNGLSTGVMTNMPVTDATPAACYAHANDRRQAGEIFVQLLKPRYGDGVDVLIGPVPDGVYAQTEKMGLNIRAELSKAGYAVRDSLDAVSTSDKRTVALLKTDDYDLWDGIQRAVSILSKNPKGYFLMVEWDGHTNNLRRGLDRVIELDTAIRKTSELVSKDTLIIFAADHSYDIRLRGGRPGQPLLPPPGEGDGKNIRVNDEHTGEHVLVTAMGPGAERVKGFIANTDIFRIMLAAYGWQQEKAAAAANAN